MLWEAVDVFFAPDLCAIDVYFEYATFALDHLRIDVEFLFDRLRQTGGSGVIISLHAVFNANFHGLHLLINMPQLLEHSLLVTKPAHTWHRAG